MPGLISRRKFLALSACMAVVPYGYAASDELVVTRKTVSVRQLPASFAGFTICHLTDLHSREFGSGNRDLLSIIQAEKPDLIAMTGDMIDVHNPDHSVCLDLCRSAAGIAPTKYVSGNHEMYDHHRPLLGRVQEQGVELLDNRHVVLQRGNDAVYLTGVGEYSWFGDQGLAQAMAALPEDACSIVLSHHPEQMAEIAGRGGNLILAGHTHGGQVKLPLVGAVAIPDQGMLPHYTEGFYHENGATMFISRGLGYSILPYRFNCQPEVVFLTLEPAGING